jgi:hypothetical protein
MVNFAFEIFLAVEKHLLLLQEISILFIRTKMSYSADE